MILAWEGDGCYYGFSWGVQWVVDTDQGNVVAMEKKIEEETT
jgi:hypothetical protein